ncbi:hypothetical protein COLO4_21395 [Corchorus olitorius]|uniref:Uncharacterized protein n=1 Tax=Corchorus olitorius TaxID=93759 RepID=A0A1R3ITJ6_9ROSI|nr:hypothetical protein COLO4_21395 [Corchorus olitorius]
MGLLDHPLTPSRIGGVRQARAVVQRMGDA